jgi:hypothetical protein
MLRIEQPRDAATSERWSKRDSLFSRNGRNLFERGGQQSGAHMGVLIVKCPATGKMFSTGILADAETVKSLPPVQSRSKCPHCRSDHLWWPEDIVFAPALARSAWVENQRWPPDDTA